MNLGPGGKQPVIRDTEFYSADGRHHQSMVFQRGDIVWETNEPIPEGLIGKPKGMKRILQERSLWTAGLKKQCHRKKKDKGSHTLGFGDRLFEETIQEYEARTADCCETGKGCCALRILEVQTDFQEEKSMLETIIVEAGHEVIFYPKFHCELNYIEYYWAYLTRYARTNCRYSFSELEKTVISAMNSVELKTIRRFADRSKRWVMAYINGLTMEQREFSEKQYKSHRRAMWDTFV